MLSGSSSCHRVFCRKLIKRAHCRLRRRRRIFGKCARRQTGRKGTGQTHRPAYGRRGEATPGQRNIRLIVFCFNFQNVPYLMQRQPEGEFSGFVPDFLEALSNVVPFAYKIQAIRHRDYGRRSENGTWSGLMAEVVNKVSAHKYSMFFQAKKKQLSTDGNSSAARNSRSPVSSARRVKQLVVAVFSILMYSMSLLMWNTYDAVQLKWPIRMSYHRVVYSLD